MRNANRGAVVKELILGNAQSRIELSNKLGLSRMAISAIVNEMIEQNYIEECSFGKMQDMPKKTGRTPVILKVSDKSINAVGIYIKRFEIHCVLADIQGRIFTMIADSFPAIQIMIYSYKFCMSYWKKY